MRDATDAIHALDQFRRDLRDLYDQLTAHDDLQRHCDNQRKRIAELEGLYAGAKAEVAELKEQTRWMAQTDSRWEAAVRDLEQAKAENNKLRELVRDMRLFILLASATAGVSILAHGKPTLGMEAFERRMRELGVEVDA